MPTQIAMTPIEGLRNDYLEYLRDSGLEAQRDKPASFDIAAGLEEIARLTVDEALRRSVIEHLDAAATVEKLTGLPADEARAALQVGTGSSDLTSYVDVVLAGLTPNDAESLKTMPIYFGLIPRGWFNAMVVPSKHGRLCLLDTGLPTLLFSLSKAVAFLVERSDDGILEAPAAESGRFNDRVTLAYSSAAAAALNYFAQARKGARSMTYKPILGPKAYEPWQIIAANALTFSMKSFVMAHEIGHAVLGHVGQVVETSGASVTPRRTLESPHDQEFAADRFGFDTLLRSDAALQYKYPVAPGAICFLTCYLFLLRMRTRLTGVLHRPDVASESHPAPLDRVRRLVALALAEQDSLHPAFLAMTALFRKLLEVDEIMEVTFNPDGSLTVRPKNE